MADGSVTVALLAAGSGHRFGGGKLDCDLGGKPVGCWAARTAEAVGFSRQLIVTPPTAPLFVDQLDGWERVINPDPGRSMASSIRAAASAALGSRRLVIMLADMPFIMAEHLRRLSQGTAISFTHYGDGRRGVPAAFPEQFMPVIRNLPDGQRLASIVWEAPVILVRPRYPDTLFDIDSRADLDEAHALMRSGLQVPGRA